MNREELRSPAVLLAALLLTGCAGQAASEASGRTATSSSATPTETAPSSSATPTEPTPSTHGGSGDGAPGEGAAPGQERPDPVPAPHPPASVPQGSEGPQIDWPPEVTPVHGSRVWAVYLAVGSPDSQWEMHFLGEAEGYLQGHGYTGSGIGSVGCDLGAAEALGFDPDHHRVAVYFDSAARAQEFVSVYDRQDIGSAEVTTYCLD